MWSDDDALRRPFPSLSTQLDYSIAEFERIKARHEHEQATFEEEYVRDLNVALGAIDALRDEVRSDSDEGAATRLPRARRCTYRARRCT